MLFSRKTDEKLVFNKCWPYGKLWELETYGKYSVVVWQPCCGGYIPSSRVGSGAQTTAFWLLRSKVKYTVKKTEMESYT